MSRVLTLILSMLMATGATAFAQTAAACRSTADGRLDPG
jgi:hypothetical protein